MRISELLSKMKNAGSVDPMTLELFRQTVANRGVDTIRLWNMSSTYRFVMAVVKFQAYGVALAGLTIFPYIMYEKYLAEPEKIQRIAIATPIISLAMLAPLIYFRRFSRKLLTNITYEISENKFALTKLGGGQTLKVNPESLACEFTPNHRIKTVHVGEEAYNIEGAGEWESIELFKYIQREKGL